MVTTGPAFATGALVDHHCHGVVTADLDRARFEGMLNEAEGPSPLGTTLFDSMLGLAVRRWCAPVLDLEPHAHPDAYLSRRRELGAAEVNRRFLTRAGISDVLVDTGYSAPDGTTLDELGSLAGAEVREVVRLETVGQAALASGIGPAGFADEVETRLRRSGAVGAKSIAAYRTGLQLPAVKPTPDQLAAAVGQVRPDAAGAYRIAHPVVQGWLAWTAVEVGLPLQFHVGYGDNDVDLRDCDPLCLTGFLRATADRGVPVLLLHNYPFHRHAAYLAQVFDHVFMDLGLATHNVGAMSATLLRESLELVPFGKLLFSSDAFGLSELYYLGTLLFRRGLDEVLGSLVEADEMTTADAEHVAALVSRDNARRAYRLSVG